MRNSALRLLVLALALALLAGDPGSALADVLVLPESLEAIPDQCFEGDTSLDVVVLGSQVTQIGARAFADSSVSRINLPENLTQIADDIFDGAQDVQVSAVLGTYAYDWAVTNGYLHRHSFDDLAAFEKLDQPTVSGTELAELLDQFVYAVAPDRLSSWQALYPACRASDAPLVRYEAMIYWFLAAQHVGGRFLGQLGNGGYIAQRYNHDWDLSYLNMELFGGWEAFDDRLYDAGASGMKPLVEACYFYNLSRPSLVSGQMPFEAEPEHQTFRLPEQASYRDCLLAISRLLESVPGDSVTGAEFAGLVDGFVANAAPDRLASWQALYPEFRSCALPLLRGEALLYLYLASQHVGGRYLGHLLNVGTVFQNYDDDWDSAHINYQRFGGMECFREGAYDAGGFGMTNVDAASYFYNMARPSLVSGRLPFDAAPGTTSLRLQCPATREDCVQAIARLEESVPEDAISGSAFAQLVDEFVSDAAPDKLSSWQTLYPAFRSSELPLLRGEAWLYLYLASQHVGGRYLGHLLKLRRVYQNYDFDMASEHLRWPLFGGFEGFEENGYDGGDFGMMNVDGASLYYNISHPSVVSGKLPFETAPDSSSFHFRDPATREDCVQAIARLQESVQAVSPEDYLAITNTIDPSVIALAQQTNIRAMDELPRLTGFVLNADNISIASIQDIASWGFSSVRYQPQYEEFFSEDCETVKMAALFRLDSFVQEAILSGIHLNLFLFSLPGRTHSFSGSNYHATGDFDLFVNDVKMERAKRLWRCLALRYNNVPGAYLSFGVNFEGLNYNRSTGLPYPAYDEYDVARGIDTMVGALREGDPNRFVIYEVDGCMEEDREIRHSTPCYNNLRSKYDNIRIQFNFNSAPFTYAAFPPSGDGVDIDYMDHSAFHPDYPAYVYSLRDSVDSYSDITLDGCLPAGTVIDLYVSRTHGGGDFSIASGDRVYCQETLEDATYATSEAYFFYHPYATSERKISITLAEDTDLLTLHCSGEGSVTWCGMDVFLPEEYAVERWYSHTAYDAFLQGLPAEPWAEKLRTRRIMIHPWTIGTRITIHDDVTYSTDEIALDSTPASINAWGQKMKAFAPRATVRFESAIETGAKTSKNILAYYGDVLGMLDNCGYDWYSNDFNMLTPTSSGDYFSCQEAELIHFGRYKLFDIALLRLFQAHA